MSVIERMCQPRKSNHVLVVGDSVIDQWYHGSASRISPESPVLCVSAPTAPVHRPGGAANAAAQFKYINSVKLITVYDAKFESLFLEDGEYPIDLDAGGWVDVGGIRIDEGQLPVKTRVRAGGQDVCRVDRELPNCGMDSGHWDEVRAAILREAAQSMPSARTLLVCDYGKGLFDADTLGELFAIADRSGVPIVVDPCVRRNPINFYNGADIIKLNRDQANMVNPGMSRKDQARDIMTITGATVVITGGSQPPLCYDGRFHTTEPVSRREIASVVGAGDCFAAFLAGAIANGAACCDSFDIAYRAAAEYVRHAHNTPVRPETVRDYMTVSDKIIDPGLLPGTLRSLWGGSRVVVANGVFDLLHAGHVRMLRQARAMGDCLVVAVNSDESARRLKGAERPIIDQGGRAEMLAALSCVDVVTIFDEDTPEELLAAVGGVHAIVKGDEYRGTAVAGERHARRVVFVPITGEHTSQIVGRIADTIRL